MIRIPCNITTQQMPFHIFYWSYQYFVPLCKLNYSSIYFYWSYQYFVALCILNCFSIYFYWSYQYSVALCIVSYFSIYFYWSYQYFVALCILIYFSIFSLELSVPCISINLCILNYSIYIQCRTGRKGRQLLF